MQAHSLANALLVAAATLLFQGTPLAQGAGDYHSRTVTLVISNDSFTTNFALRDT